MTASTTPVLRHEALTPGSAGPESSGAPPRRRAREARLPAAELEALRPRMAAVARGVVRHPDAAEDVVQSAYLKAVRGYDRFDGRARLSTWLHRIVVNEGLMWLRTEARRRRRVQLASETGIDCEQHRAPDCDPARPLMERESLARLRSALAALPPAERDVLECCALAGQSYDEYAHRTGVGAGAAKSRAHRARKRLQSLLATP